MNDIAASAAMFGFASAVAIFGVFYLGQQIGYSQGYRAGRGNDHR